jgi:hypothetical protein
MTTDGARESGLACGVFFTRDDGHEGTCTLQGHPRRAYGHPSTARSRRLTNPQRPKETPVIVLGIVLLLIGFIAKIPILWSIGIVVLVIGLILLILGAMGRAVGGRKHYY